MDINRILAELREERQRIEEAITVLERLGTEGGKGGRSSRWVAEVESAVTGADRSDGKRRFSPEARKRMAEAQRKRWAAARGEQPQE